MSRRRNSWIAGSACIVFILAACSSGSGGSKSSTSAAGSASATAQGLTASGAPGNYAGTTIVYATPGPGAYTDAEVAAYVKPFEDLTGVKVVLTTQDTAKLTAMVKAGNVSWDVTDSTPFFDRMHCGEIVQPMNLSGVNGAFADGAISSCGRPSIISGSLFMYNSKTYTSNPPSTLADFFNAKKYPGTRVMPDQSYSGYFEDALLADGVAIDKLYPLDTARALKVFAQIKSDSKVTPTGSQEQQLMLNNQADLAIVPSTRAFSVLTAGGTNWKIMPTPVGLLPNEWAIPKGSPHADIAAQFIKFASQPAQQEKFAQTVGGLSPANTAVKPTYTGLSAQVNPLQFTPQFSVNVDYWSKNYDTLIKLFETWSTS
jgi:putative spermidine/putrescine transport system substrate-binding protein